MSGRLVHYKINNSERARRIKISIYPHRGIEVTVPTGTRTEEIEKILEDKRRWLEKHEKLIPKGWNRIETGRELMLLGRRYLLFVEQTNGKDTVELNGARINVRIKKETQTALKELLNRWYRKEARGIIGGRAGTLANELGIKFSRISIRDQRSRWASLSNSGELSFNFRLVMAPGFIIDYVILHELSHVEEFNHSKGFWELVEKRCPEYRECEKWLDENANLLAL